MAHNNPDQALLHLLLISGIGPAIVERLLGYLTAEQFGQLYGCTKREFRQWGISEAASEKIVTGLADKALLETELERIARYKITFVSAFSETYPFLLQQIHLPPLGLYVRGELPTNYVKSLAVVGSRQAYTYAQQVIEYIIPPLVEEGWLIVSGGAIGADTMAHAEVLRSGGKTVAVIGSGLLNPYPASNKKLFDQIVEQGGAVVSPFPLLMQGFPQNFPARNRIIAGMTRGCLVIQAAEKSGALITADIALKEGREVFAVPGLLFDPLSAGCHRLLTEGAFLARSAQDIMHACGFPTKPLIRSIEPDKIPVVKTEKLMIKPIEDLPLLLQFCLEPRSIDALLAYDGCSQQELYEKLWEYQVAGLLEEVSSGLWHTLKHK